MINENNRVPPVELNVETCVFCFMARSETVLAIKLPWVSQKIKFTIKNEFNSPLICHWPLILILTLTVLLTFILTLTLTDLKCIWLTTCTAGHVYGQFDVINGGLAVKLMKYWSLSVFRCAVLERMECRKTTILSTVFSSYSRMSVWLMLCMSGKPRWGCIYFRSVIIVLLCTYWCKKPRCWPPRLNRCQPTHAVNFAKWWCSVSKINFTAENF